MTASQRGFSLVELVVVLFVMSILATIGLQAANKVQMRARDAQRISDIGQLKHVLGVYYSQYDRYPNTAEICGNPSNGGWNDSYYIDNSQPICSDPNQFINGLFTSRLIARVMVDPLNTPTYYYSYYRFTAAEAAQMGCTAKPFYILGARRFEALATIPSDSGFICGSRDFQDEFTYVIGAFE